MSALAALQERFMAALLHDAPWDDGRIAIYRRGVRASHQGALAAAYPVVQRLVGAAFFAEAARCHALDTPSASGDLAHFGAGFPRFLAAYPHARGLAYLPDVARLEWAVHECERAPGSARLDPAGLAQVAAGRYGEIRLILAPAVRLVDSAHPILSLWEANQPGRDGVPARLEGPDRVLVHRPGEQARAVALDAAEWTLLEACAAGRTLGAALDALGPAAGAALAPALLRLVAAGAFAGFEPPPA